MTTSKYVPTAADLAFRDADGDGVDDFTLAQRMQSISDEYLSVLAHDNSGPTSAGFKAMIDAEIMRRATKEAKQANKVARWSFGFAVVACIIALGDAIF